MSTPPRPAVPTLLTVYAGTRGGRLDLVRAGAAQEFTVTLRNGNTHAYRHLRLAFQMEGLIHEPGDEPGSGPGFVLEKWDHAAGAWRTAQLRVANDVLPHSMYEGGTPLAREATRTERYRLRATATGPTGSTPLMVYAIDTDAPASASPDRARPGYFSLSHTTSQVLSRPGPHGPARTARPARPGAAARSGAGGCGPRPV
ncbi:hypothetical protein [Streptomyces sp. NPDC051219]|uniref:hypothetical protein n=1 Tax=Streptomyces sp. NPDC051219 TaxID=3155283 RepID=UPI003440A3EE